MKQFGYVEKRNPVIDAFRDGLRRTYEVSDEPLPTQMDQLMQQLTTSLSDDENTTVRKQDDRRRE
jgi:hypothetical protein